MEDMQSAQALFKWATNGKNDPWPPITKLGRPRSASAINREMVCPPPVQESRQSLERPNHKLRGDYVSQKCHKFGSRLVTRQNPMKKRRAEHAPTSCPPL
jgi:hypothetical protein